MFVDDLVLFAEATEDQVLVVKDCLKPFCAALGQKINHEKSKIIFSPNMDPSNAELISETVGIPATISLDRYLGIPTLLKMVAKDMF